MTCRLRLCAPTWRAAVEVRQPPRMTTRVSAATTAAAYLHNRPVRATDRPPVPGTVLRPIRRVTRHPNDEEILTGFRDGLVIELQLVFAVQHGSAVGLDSQPRPRPRVLRTLLARSPCRYAAGDASHGTAHVPRARRHDKFTAEREPGATCECLALFQPLPVTVRHQRAEPAPGWGHPRCGRGLHRPSYAPR